MSSEVRRNNNQIIKGAGELSVLRYNQLELAFLPEFCPLLALLNSQQPAPAPLARSPSYTGDRDMQTLLERVAHSVPQDSCTFLRTLRGMLGG